VPTPSSTEMQPRAGPRFGVTIASDPEGAVIAVRGDLDLATAGRLDRFLTNIRHFVPSFDLDMGEVGFVDVAGIRPVLQLHETLAGEGETLVIRRASPAVRRLVRLVRLLPIGLELADPADRN